MDNPNACGITLDGPARYQIMVKGGIPEKWSNRLEGMSIQQAAADNGGAGHDFGRRAC